MDSPADAGEGILAPGQWQRLAVWLRAADIDVLEIESAGSIVRMVRQANGYEPQVLRQQMTVMQAACAPCAGVFRAKHPWAAEAAPAAGQPVHAGERVGVLQVGLLLVPLVAPVAGTFAGVRVAEGTLVGYGSPLVDIKEESHDGD